jgi:hypothetical protein
MKRIAKKIMVQAPFMRRGFIRGMVKTLPGIREGIEERN